jgi:glycosyltransferase involved in cell wall biosynthesis
MERLLADLVRRVDPDRFESHVLALQYLGRFSEGLDRVATLHVADPLPRYSMVWPGPLIRQIRRIGPDVVHSHSGVWYKGSLAARRAGVHRVVHTEHGRGKPDPWEARVLDGLASRRTDLIVAVSDVLAEQLATTVVRHPERIRVIRNGVDTSAYRPRPDQGAIRRELGLAPEIPILGSIGRLEQIKGFDVMLEAFVMLRAGWSEGPAPALLVAGDGAERPRLAAWIEEHALQGEVHLLGWRDDVHALHEAFTLFTMSSRSEGTSLSLLEAMSAGLCPVVTDVGGNAAVLGPDLRHRLVPDEDAAALAAAWRAALLDRPRREQDALAARRRVQSAFDIDAMVRAYEALYAARMGT